MYAEFFGLAEMPFNNTPDPRFFYATPDHEEALASMIYAVSEGKGLMLLTGEVGAGKTLLTKILTQRFGGRICAATINHTVTSAGDLVGSICNGFGLPVPDDAAASTCIHVLHDFLLAQRAHNMPVVLMIDEAQGLPRECFEQLRTLGNMEDHNATLLQTLIIGQPSLRRLFQLPDMHQLHQRLFRAFHLPALTRAQCPGYVQHRLNVAGAEDAQIFDDSATEVIHGYSQGSPRLINTLCDNAMLSAYSADLRSVSGELVEAVIDQMMTVDQQPVPRGATRTPHIPTPVYVAGDFRQRIERVESDHGSLTDRIGKLERAIGTSTDPRAHAATRTPSRQPAGTAAEARAEPATAPSVCDSDSTATAGSRDAAQVAALKNAEKNVPRPITDNLYRRVPELAAASARRDQQVRRLTSVVKWLAERVQENRTEARKQTSAAQPEPATWWSALAAHDESDARAAPQPVVAASERLKELVHQARTSMGDLRSLISDRSCPASARAPMSVTALPSRFESPVTLLANEVKHLSDAVAES